MMRLFIQPMFHLQQLGILCVTRLTNYSLIYIFFLQTSEMTLTNVERMTIGYDETIHGQYQFSKAEIGLLTNLGHIFIRGKCGTRVPILVNSLARRAMQTLTEFRERCGAPRSNKFFFACNYKVIFTPPQNFGGVIFLLQFVCLCVCVCL